MENTVYVGSSSHINSNEMKALIFFSVYLVCFIILFVLSSCRQYARTILEYYGLSVEEYKVHNIYSTVDVSIFRRTRQTLWGGCTTFL